MVKKQLELEFGLSQIQASLMQFGQVYANSIIIKSSFDNFDPIWAS